jgi:subtilisin family serine protease
MMRKNSIFLNSFRAASVLLATAIVLSSVPAAAAPMGFSGNHTNRGNSANAPGNSGAVAETKRGNSPAAADLLQPAPNRPDGKPAQTSGAVIAEDKQQPGSKAPAGQPSGISAPGKPSNLAKATAVKSVNVKAARAANAKAAKGERGKPAWVNGKIPKPGKTAPFLVVFNEGTDLEAAAGRLNALKANVSKRFGGAVPALSVRLTDKQIEELAMDPSVAFIERDFEIRLVDPARDFEVQAQSNAPWGLDRIDSLALPLDGIYTFTRTALGVTTYVVDTGVRASHVDFGGRVQAGFSSVADGRGTDDCNGHGTHVAGTIAGNTFGVAKSASVVPVRVLACDGAGTLSGVIAGLDWIGANYTPGTPAVVNMSLGGGASSSLDAAVSGLIAKGITVVVAAGNSATDACTASPARVPAAITVAASTSADNFASYSNFGNCVDVIAPGSSIASTWFSSDTASAVASGTSMAAPHVAGAVALMLEAGYKEPGLIAASLTAKAAKDKVSNMRPGTVNYLVHTDPFNLIADEDASAPEAVGSLSFVAAARRVATASWSLPEDGGSPLTLITVELYNAAGNRLSTSYLSGTSTALSFRNLRQGVSYYVVVTAANLIGSSESATSNQVTAFIR